MPQSKTSSLSSSTYTPILVILVIVGAFFLGMLITKVQYLEGQKTAQAPQQQLGAKTGPAEPTQKPITAQDMKDWAKQLGLDTKKFDACFDGGKYKDVIQKDQADGQTAGVGGTPSFFVNGTLLVGAQPYTAFKDAIEKALSGTVGNVQVDNGHIPVLGASDAKVTVVEFSDFECPFCRNFFKETFGQIKKDYVDTGKVKVFYRHYPLPFHPNAMPFAIASECANEQGKFWQMHDKIFSSQP